MIREQARFRLQQGLQGLPGLPCTRALKHLKHATEYSTEWVSLAVKRLWEGKQATHAHLERLGIADAKSVCDMFVQKLFAGNL